MTTQTLTLIALLLLAVAMLVAATGIWYAQRSRGRNVAVMENALRHAKSPALRMPAESSAAVANADQEARLRKQWLDNRAAKALVADEDRHLIQQAGLPTVMAQIVLLVSRIALTVALPLLANAAQLGGPFGSSKSNLVLASAVVLGYMLPKWILQSFASRGRRQVGKEMPLFVDLLGLLQGVGMSLDQSLQVVAKEFRGVLPVLSREVERANRHYAQGRSREHAFQRIATLHGNQHLADFIGLMLQVDKHGGAIQEPIRQFSERLRVHRKAEMKTRVGAITVKMTVVMVTTLLPALMVITAGPGFLAVMRSLGSMIR
jgi:tight adherence protein C